MALRKYVDIWNDHTAPPWDGPLHCVTSSTFLKSYFEYECSEKGYIETLNAYNFVEMLLSDMELLTYNKQAIDDFKMNFHIRLRRKRNRWISMKELFYSLPMMESNFLLKYRGRRAFTSVDLMQIWSHYDPFDTGYIDNENVMGFAFDLLLDPTQKYKPVFIKALHDKLLRIAGSRDLRIAFQDLPKILNLRNNIMSQFPNKSVLSEADFDEIFAQYDQDNSGSIGGCELEALIKDITEFSGKTADLKLIKETKETMLNASDVNGDGSVDRAELKALLTLYIV